MKVLHRKGLLLKPSKDIWWMSTHVGPSYIRHVDSSHYEIFITGRADDNKSRIGRSLVKYSSGVFTPVLIEKDPLFDCGKPGLFDDCGVSYPWIVVKDQTEYMFYVGWSRNLTTGFHNFLGLATRPLNSNQEFSRLSLVPILDRTHNEPYGTGSCCVYWDKQSSCWTMFYTAFLGWPTSTVPSSVHTNRQPSYNIKLATSADLITWKRFKDYKLSFAPGEHIIGKPVILEEDKIHMWFSVRGESYKIGYASAISDNQFQRVAQSEITLQPIPCKDDWDSDMQEYAFPLRCDGKLFIFYNGNSYGGTGLGYGTWG